MSILSHLSKNITLNESDLWRYIVSAPYRYKKYKIKKRNGKGYRDIAQPAKGLKFIQRTAVQVIDQFIDLPIHDCATAYRKNINIYNNAEPHKDNSYLLKMDFSNFFPSLRPIDLISHIDNHKEGSLEHSDKLLVSKLFFYKKYRNSDLVLSIGSPTSPYISNTLMYGFDNLVSTYCSQANITYTRYADDLTFSTSEKNILFDVPKFIQEVLSKIEYPSLEINNEKTVFLSKKYNRHITGLVISNDGMVSIGRKKKRYIRSLVYKFCDNKLSDEDKIYLCGYISFCSGIDAEFTKKLESKYGIENLNRIRCIDRG